MEFTSSPFISFASLSRAQASKEFDGAFITHPLVGFSSSPPNGIPRRNVNNVKVTHDEFILIGRSLQSYLSIDGIKANAKDKKEMDQSVESSRLLARMADPSEPGFIVIGGNGAYIIDRILSQLGWRRISDKTSNKFQLLWSEVRSGIDYDNFQEGQQMVNRIPNCYLLTNKLGLLLSLQRFEHVWMALNLGQVVKLRTADFLPETYRIDDVEERKTFFYTFKKGDIWICKPTGSNQGRGIYLVRDLQEFKIAHQDLEDMAKRLQRPPQMDRIVQRYIMNPLLLNGKKFDIRVFMLVASTVPFLVLYHGGYARICLHDYEKDHDNLAVHLTNQFIQRREANYDALKETTIWSFDQLNEYINEKYAKINNIEVDWVFKSLTSQMKTIMLHSFQAVKHKLKAKIGFFDLYGFDFLIDDAMKVWLIEVNVNPCLATNCSILKRVIVPVVQESLYLAIECFEKSRRGISLTPLDTLVNFEVIYNGSADKSNQSTHAESLNSACVALRRLCNLSPSVDSRDPVITTNVSSTTEEAVDCRRKVKCVSFQNVDDKSHNADHSSVSTTSAFEPMTSSKSVVFSAVVSAVKRNTESGSNGRLTQLGYPSDDREFDKSEILTSVAPVDNNSTDSKSDSSDIRHHPGLPVDLQSTVKTSAAAAAAAVATPTISRGPVFTDETGKWAESWRASEEHKVLAVTSNSEMTSTSKQTNLTSLSNQKLSYVSNGRPLLDNNSSSSVAARMYSSQTTNVSTTTSLRSQPRVTMNFAPSFRNETIKMPPYLLSSTSSAAVFALPGPSQNGIKKRHIDLGAMIGDKADGNMERNTLTISSWPPAAPPSGRGTTAQLLSDSAAKLRTSTSSGTEWNVASHKSTGGGSQMTSRAADNVGSPYDPNRYSVFPGNDSVLPLNLVGGVKEKNDRVHYTSAKTSKS